MGISAGRNLPANFSVRVAVVGVLDGTLERAGVRHDVNAGAVGSIGVARLWNMPASWFATTTLAFSASRASTGAGSEHATLTATDLRFGATAGRAFGRYRPYALARLFAGPVSWQVAGETKGSDTSKFQLGVGATVALPAKMALIVDASVLGERAGSLAVAYSL